MASYIRISSPEAEGGMGSVFTDIEVLNHEDEILARNGHLAAEKVRRIHLTNVLVDTGATTLCLPKSLIEQLGLPLKRRVTATTAAGEVETDLFEAASIYVAGRDTVVDCLAITEGARPLLGVIPLEIMGLEPDLTLHVLRVLPNDTSETYIMA
jgi:clan AA aspartic protease